MTPDSDRARRQADQALAVPAEPVARLGPSGFDPSRKTWTLDEAVALCCAVEEVCPPFGCHVALTGGTLYKRGARKDLDLLFYRIRQEPEIDMDGLWAELTTLGIVKKSGFGWCHKAEFQGRKIDCFFPEEQGGEYAEDNDNIIEMVDFPAIAMEARQGGDVQQAPSRSDDSAGRQASPGKDRGDHD